MDDDPARVTDPRLALALHVAQMTAWTWELATDEIVWADGSERELGRTLGAVLEHVHPDDREAVRTALARAAAGSRFELEYRIVLPDGRIRWRTAAGERLAAGDRVVGVGRDVTERKEADERLRQAEGRYRTLVEQLPLVSYVEQLDAESAMYMSPQIAEMAGYTAEEWVSDPSFFAAVLHPEDRDRVLAAFAAMHESGEQLEVEYRIRARDGRTVCIHDAAVVVRDDAGAPLYAQGYMIDISERKRSEDALRASEEKLREQMQLIEHQALHDALTGLPNRTLFNDRAEQALLRAVRNRSGFTIMLIDLDRFKEVNDTLGHQSGDLLLREIGERLRQALRRSDTVARLGGDEFGVVAPDLSDAHVARLLADKLREELARPLVVSGLTIEVEGSVGIAMYPDHGEDVETLVRHADVSMYVSKNTHTPIVYAPAYDHHSLARLALISELRRAVDEGELIVHYQPQTDVATGDVHMVEALVRWQHPEHGLLGPDQFIPLAEQSGLMRALTRYVLDAALRQCHLWHAEGREVGVAVNITGRELVDLGFPDEVRTLLAKWRIPPHKLELEITENTIMVDPLRAGEVLARLHRIGVRIAIDDFGSGHSSFAYLRQLPVDVLKIDKSFIEELTRDPTNTAIVQTAIDLGHNLGLEVVAEGVETEAAKRRLEELGCDTLQGFLLGRPQGAVGLTAIGASAPERAAAG
jgi:diguanylate cyclase (GGDEF)-like protein/PAS domain S-box-containing protein